MPQSEGNIFGHIRVTGTTDKFYTKSHILMPIINVLSELESFNTRRCSL